MTRRAFVLAFVIVFSLSLASLGSGGIVHLLLEGSINPVSKDLVLRAIAQAEEEGAELFVIELNTPGGLGESMRDIVIAELASSVPIVVFVGPAGARAASAGVLITLAADVAAMAPGTNIGAAHPVNLMGGGEEQDETMAEKSTNDAVAFAKSVAEERGRNVEWAEAAVRESSSITALEALDQGVIDLIADDLDDLLVRLDGYTLPDGRTLHTSGRTITEIRPTLRERLLNYLADPNIVYILFILGLYGLIYEFFQPGIGFGLAAGGICLILAFLGLQILPVNTVGVALILFGTLLMVLDAFTPTNGILTIGGVIALLAGSFTLFDIQNRAIGLSWATVFLTVGTITALFVFIISKGLLIQRRRPVTGKDGMIDSVGTAKNDLDPAGTVFVHGEYWHAISVEDEILSGDKIVVEKVEKSTLVVRRAR
ncbi:MAG: nodulation protein NfeD [Candidatus Bipolaricaulota bacterium]|nr:nodulation protein NfeD [Candidatus Bipolaricaulota bacterium]